MLNVSPYIKHLLLLVVLVCSPFMLTINGQVNSYPISTSVRATAARADVSPTNPNLVLMDAFDSHVRRLYYDCGLHNKQLDYHIFKYAMTGYYNMKREGSIASYRNYLTIIDYEKPSSEKRMYIVDMRNRRVVHHTYVAHGRNSGYMYASMFSNTPNSKQSSLGFFKTLGTYYGKFGYSLRIDGKDLDFNTNALKRGIVIHGADYVSQFYAQNYGGLGTTWGCPAVSRHETRSIIDLIKGGHCIFIYANNLFYLNDSKYLNTYTAAKYYSTRR